MEGLSEIWVSVRLTIELPSIATVILLILGTPLAWWLARSKSMWSELVATIIVLPPMLPQPVLGFYLLALLGPTGPGGLLASPWGERTLAFTFRARYRIGFERAACCRAAYPQRLRYHGRPTAGNCGHSARVSIICLLYGRTTFGTTGFSHRRRARLCAYDRRIRGRADGWR